MADVQVPAGSPFIIQSGDQFILGDSSDEGVNGGWLVQIVDDNSFSGSISVTAQSLVATRSGLAVFDDIDYRGGNVNGTGADWSYVSTALTTDSIIFIPAGGMTVALNCGTYTSGSVTVYAQPVIGACSF